MHIKIITMSEDAELLAFLKPIDDSDVYFPSLMIEDTADIYEEAANLIKSKFGLELRTYHILTQSTHYVHTNGSSLTHVFVCVLPLDTVCRSNYEVLLWKDLNIPYTLKQFCSSDCFLSVVPIAAETIRNLDNLQDEELPYI